MRVRETARTYAREGARRESDSRKQSESGKMGE